MYLAVQCRRLCLPVLPVVEEAEQELAQDKKRNEVAQDLVVGVETSRLESGSDRHILARFSGRRKLTLWYR